MLKLTVLKWRKDYWLLMKKIIYSDMNLIVIIFIKNLSEIIKILSSCYIIYI